ncbi:MAG: DUF4234 domain-containing protein [Candidatus Bathyarchaeota archaeon]|nr:DUF4234 domain-containing protein [Candidatus Bathyarchaeota archaeon]MDH5746944.1 DUF4234 domain-containing protein [Candidatus Bathyarchaeota archaeon]
MSVPVENLRKDIRMRDESDPIMSNAWLIVRLLPFFVVIIGIASIFFGLLLFPTWGAEVVPIFVAWVILIPLLAIIGFIVSVILTYKLVKRRNTHFKRQTFLTEDIVTAVKAIAGKKGVDVEVGLSSCERTVREAKAEETEKGAVLWAILSVIIFIADWYVNYFLMKDFYKHERREDGFWEDLSKTLDKLGITFSVPRRTETTPNRSFVLYLILSIITLGLFGIYWLYVLLKDPNEHFKYHRQVEDQILSTLESAAI